MLSGSLVGKAQVKDLIFKINPRTYYSYVKDTGALVIYSDVPFKNEKSFEKLIDSSNTVLLNDIIQKAEKMNKLYQKAFLRVMRQIAIHFSKEIYLGDEVLLMTSAITSDYDQSVNKIVEIVVNGTRMGGGELEELSPKPKH